MTAREARQYIQKMTTDGRGFSSQFGGAQWQDPCHVATDAYRPGVIAKLSRETVYDTSALHEGPYSGVGLIEIYLTETLPDIQWFYGIFAVDDFGIWYFDREEAVTVPVARQRVIPWRYVKGVVIHELVP